MKTIMLTILDKRAIPVVAVALEGGGDDDAILRACGYYGSAPHGHYVLLARINGGLQEARIDPYAWNHDSEVMQAAHLHICKNWPQLRSGDTVDVPFILGESKEKRSFILGS